MRRAKELWPGLTRAAAKTPLANKRLGGSVTGLISKDAGDAQFGKLLHQLCTHLLPSP